MTRLKPRSVGGRWIGLLIGVVFLGADGSALLGQMKGDRSAGGEDAPALHPRVRLSTTHGDMVLELDASRAPRTVANFVRYVRDRFYDGTVFHRVLPGVLVQGGMYTPNLSPRIRGLRDPVDVESERPLPNIRGAVALYREVGTLQSGRAEFFINLRENLSFGQTEDGYGYTVFGRVVEGMDVLDGIAAVKTEAHPRYAAGRSPVVPLEPVVIRRARLLTKFDSDSAIALAEQAEKDRVRREEELRRRHEQLKRELDEQIVEQTGSPLVTTSSGLRYSDQRVGRGLSPSLTDTILIRFRGALLDGMELDNTFVDEEPPRKKVSELIAGLQEAVLGMQEGGLRKVIVPPALAFGADGIPGRIPPSATIIYDLELLEIDNDD